MPHVKPRVLTSTTALSMFPVENEEIKRQRRGKFQRQTSVLMWKSYLQRQRRWRVLAIETFIGMVLFLMAIFIAKPVFLTPLQAEPEAPLTVPDMLSSLHTDTILGYAPNGEPFSTVMNKASDALGIEVMNAHSEEGLNEILYNKSRGIPIKRPIIWVIWSETQGKKWQFSIRCTERARYATSASGGEHPNPHLRAGFLAVQVAISQAILEYDSNPIPYEVSLVAMPVSPLMQEDQVKKALSLILMCFTLAFLPAVLETEALVVWETQNMFKRALRMRSVSYASMYASWIVYAYLTALPVCMLGAITIILTFRWIHLVTALLILISYVTVMTMVALIMAMYHEKPQIACIWTTLFTLLQTYLSELLVHHHYDNLHVGLTFLLHLILPPLGLINAFNEFALLSTASDTSVGKVLYMVLSWGFLIMFYFVLLMLLQRTVGHGAIGGQVSWGSILFKQAEDREELHRIVNPVRSDFKRLQEVDEFLAKAISFRDVTKSIMGVDVVKNLTFDIYRGEYTILFVDKIQEKMVDTLDDLLTGLALPDQGEIIIQGEVMSHDSAPLNNLYMMGYCHRSETLVDDLTVQEHFTLFSAICLWHQGRSIINEYSTIRYQHLLNECNLRDVKYTRVRDLDVYYRAQLCWALARLLEPRVIIIPFFFDEPMYRAVIKDKIMKFRNDLTVIAFYYSSLHLQHADRIFVFDSELLVFGGTPAYMFFRYGREYQVRLNLRTTNVDEVDDESDDALLKRAQAAGATVRAHLGSLLILRLPAIPTAPVAEFITDLTDNSSRYGVIPSLINVSVPDFEEVVKRAVDERRQRIVMAQHPVSREDDERIRAAMKLIAEPYQWQRRRHCHTHFRQIFRKFTQFHTYHKVLLFLTLLSACVAGLLLGLSLSEVLVGMDESKENRKLCKGEKLTVESLLTRTNLVVRAETTSPAAMSIAQSYVMSETNSTEKQVENMFYVALPHTESFKEYLVTRAIDSPQRYVYVYAYGMDVADEDGVIKIQALYSPLHRDKGAAARSLARVFMALIRHCTGVPDATIQVDDYPLALDLSPWMKDLAQPPLFLQFILILTICHITLLPSMEHGLIRHVQKHAINFSPALYWFTLYICDVMFFCVLVGIMTIMMISVMYCTVPQSLFEIYDLFILPFMLLLYGAGCVPQAYVFSLGPQIALNAMSFIIVNMVFGETTIVAKLFYGETLSYMLDVMTLSPQFNMAYAYVKIKQIFIYNTECVIFHAQNLCSKNTLHKCCEKCGILQECFRRKDYFTRQGILMEMIAMMITSVFFTTLLFLIEYRILVLIWKTISKKLYHQDRLTDRRMSGAERELKDVVEKQRAINAKRGPQVKIDTFGEYLCVSNISRRDEGLYYVRDVYLGLGRGEALAITGLKRHGRLALCEILSGFRIPCEGSAWVMSKWKLTKEVHMYCRQVSISCEYPSLPPWLTVKDALVLIATLRGIPKQDVIKETTAFIEALELYHLKDTRIENLSQFDIKRLHFAAAVVGAPPILILDEITAWQKYTVVRIMYSILYQLRKKGHAIISGSSNIESQRPVTNRLAIMMDGALFDVDTIDKLIARYSHKGYTVVVHLKDEVDVNEMISRYFNEFYINDTSEVLVNVQIYDANLTWKQIFERMEALQEEYYQVYSYIVTAITIDYIFNSILTNEKNLHPATGFFSWRWAKKIISSKPKKMPPDALLNDLQTFEQHFDINSLRGLPWSVIFLNSRDPPPAQERATRLPSTTNIP